MYESRIQIGLKISEHLTPSSCSHRNEQEAPKWPPTVLTADCLFVLFSLPLPVATASVPCLTPVIPCVPLLYPVLPLQYPVLPLTLSVCTQPNTLYLLTLSCETYKLLQRNCSKSAISSVCKLWLRVHKVNIQCSLVCSIVCGVFISVLRLQGGSKWSTAGRKLGVKLNWHVWASPPTSGSTSTTLHKYHPNWIDMSEQVQAHGSYHPMSSKSREKTLTIKNWAIPDTFRSPLKMRSLNKYFLLPHPPTPVQLNQSAGKQ